MSKAFIRALWGKAEGLDITNPRPSKMINDIKSTINAPYPFTVYTMGADNHNHLSTLGFNSKLICEEYQKWDMKLELYRHKLEVLKYAMMDYDEIVYLDWDCKLVKPLPNNFWDILSQGDSFQANLFQYRTKKCLWRKIDLRKTCNGGFIYLRDKTIPDKLIENWESLKKWVNEQKKSREEKGKELRFRETSLIFDDEPAMSMYVDHQMGEWKGVEEYWKRFEPKVCILNKKSAYSTEENESKIYCFTHYINKG